MEHYLPESDFGKILSGEKITPNYKLVLASEMETQAILEKTTGSLDNVNSLRDTVSTSLCDFSETSKEKMLLAKDADLNRAGEHKRELDLQEPEMKLKPAEAT